MIKIILTVITLFILVVSCRQQAVKEITLIVPDNYNGVIFIKRVKGVASRSANSEAATKIVVPDSGVATTSNYDLFGEWHTVSVSSEGNIAPSFVLFQLGEVDKERIVYFFGKPSEYEEKVRRVSVSDLPPGPIP